jgi:sugar phosphate isomerase/epimerase
VNPGDAEMPIAALFRTLQKIGFMGCCNLEYEVFSNSADRGRQGTPADRLAGMRTAIAYLRGVIAGLKEA